LPVVLAVVTQVVLSSVWQESPSWLVVPWQEAAMTECPDICLHLVRRNDPALPVCAALAGHRVQLPPQLGKDNSMSGLKLDFTLCLEPSLSSQARDLQMYFMQPSQAMYVWFRA
jgi:hypothetical protein